MLKKLIHKLLHSAMKGSHRMHSSSARRYGAPHQAPYYPRHSSSSSLHRSNHHGHGYYKNRRYSSS